MVVVGDEACPALEGCLAERTLGTVDSRHGWRDEWAGLTWVAGRAALVENVQRMRGIEIVGWAASEDSVGRPGFLRRKDYNDLVMFGEYPVPHIGQRTSKGTFRRRISAHSLKQA